MRTFISLLLTAFSLAAFSQKNVIPVTKSALTGIGLPEGTRQDKRLLSLSAARALLDMQITQSGRTGEGPVEVFIIPPLNAGGQDKTVVENIGIAGYRITGVAGDSDFSIITKDNMEYMMYLKETPAEVSLYFAILKNTTVVPSVKPEAPLASQPVANIVKSIPENATSGKGFAFTVTNFDDGWTSVEKDDYVLVTKNSLSVKIYYGREITEQMRPPATEISDYFWNELVLPQFQIKEAWHYQQPLSFFSVYYIYADAVDKSTGKSCFIGMNAVTNAGWTNVVLAMAPDRPSYESAFPGPDNLRAMLGYNRFAVGSSDITGTWKESSGATANYYNVYTGAYAGMGIAEGSSSFTFMNDGSYKSTHSGATGMVGNIQTYNQEYHGQARCTNWSITLTDRPKGKDDDFNAWFEAVKGGRILHLVNSQYPGIKYDLVKVEQSER